ncbi:MAG: tRNA lysidine(34) synthetase TilS [Clostridia bacterium]|nr:tRNA lysidine(34) synthetase TilS [Clostridia bacterium]
MKTVDDFCLRLSQDCTLAPRSHVLLALSGGADSTALLCLLLEARESYPFLLSCAHVEHGIRGSESLADMAFSQALCEEKRIPLYTEHVDAPGYARAHGCGLEDAARRLRYDFLHKTADAIGADVIALAHHAGDQTETVLLHALRGSDLRGLCAMRFRSGRLIRPLLDVQPDALRAYLRSIGQEWREDGTNTDPAYLRNRIRHELLPAMEQIVSGSGAALCRLSRAAQRDEDYFTQQMDMLNIRVLPLVDGAAVEKSVLSGLHSALCSRVLVRIMDRAGIGAQRADVIEAVMDALASDDATVNLTGGAHAMIGARYLCLKRVQSAPQDTALRIPGRTQTPFGCFEVHPALPGETGDGRLTQRIPVRLLAKASVGSRREGETMVPFGRKSPVKLKKLMIDAGIERAMRESMPVLRTSGGEVLFAVGLRSAQQCADHEHEEQMLVRFCGEWPCAGE